MFDLIYKEEAYSINGACFNVYKDKGCGFLEPVYQECLAIEFESLQIPFVIQPQLEIFYRGRKLTQIYKPDFVCFGKIIIELKAVKNLANEHRAQVFNYLKATSFELGLLYNFGHYPGLEYERVAFSQIRRTQDLTAKDAKHAK
ncbi:MAG: GxxExxY protein [Pyrinomonadaceae bacterium]